MKKYLGSKMTAYAAIVAPIFAIWPPLFGVSALRAEVSVATVFMALVCIACTVTMGLLIKRM